MKKIQTISFKRRKLPHWMVANKPYFVTFRVHGSLPKHVIEELKIEQNKLLFQAVDDNKLVQSQRYAFKKIEAILDSNSNTDNNYLTDPAIASLIMNSFEFTETKYSWQFPAFVIMPNHVHCLALFSNNGIKRSLVDTIGYLKSFVGRESNKLLNRTGRMWADENFDHWCRSLEKVESVIRYIKLIKRSGKKIMVAGFADETIFLTESFIAWLKQRFSEADLIIRLSQVSLGRIDPDILERCKHLVVCGQENLSNDKIIISKTILLLPLHPVGNLQSLPLKVVLDDYDRHGNNIFWEQALPEEKIEYLSRH